MTTITQSAPGKLVISGEYAVLEGYPAIACAINRRVHCTFSPQKSTSMVSLTGAADDDERNASFVRGVFSSLEEAQLSIPTGNYSLDSRELYLKGNKLGLGSSAAVCVALVRTVAAAGAFTLDDDSLFLLSLRAHRKLSGGLGSGIDVAACCSTGALTFQIQAETQRLRRELIDCSLSELPILAIFTGHSQSTVNFIDRFNHLKHDDHELHAKLVKSLAQSNELLTVALLGRDVPLLIQAFRLVSSNLADLGTAMHAPLLSTAHQKIAAIAFECQGAAKISGAGGGDISLCVVPPEHREHLSIRMKEAGFHVLDSLFL